MENEMREIYVYIILGIALVVLIFADIRIVKYFKKPKDPKK